jgi:RHS repeat-associated protein
VWRHDQAEPFGDNPPDENPSGLGVFEFPLRDEGTYFDKETNLAYNWNRYRDLSGGRFIQADPLGLNGGDLSLYVLRGNDPLSFTDPYGLRRGGARTTPNTALCDYYQKVCTSTGCRYYCYTAPMVCRGADYNPMFMWNGPGKLNCVRQCLIEEDQKARQRRQSMCTGSNCLPDDVIDDYHQRCFTKCQASGYPGVDPWWYPGPRLNPPN